MKVITLTQSELEKIYSEEEYPDFKYNDWYFHFDLVNTGKYEVSCGSKYDFDIKLYNSEDEFIGTAIGGTFDRSEGVQFPEDSLDFHKLTYDEVIDKYNDVLKEAKALLKELSNFQVERLIFNKKMTGFM